jgi:hypothetical protein
MGAKGLFLSDELRPGREQRRRVPLAIRQGCSGTPDRCLG